MDYVFWGMIAIKLGKELYIQVQELIGEKIPTWDEVAAQNKELQDLIDAEKI